MDVRAIKDKASQLFSKGKFVKAAEAYGDYCQADQKDLQARLRMGDAWAKAGQRGRAVTAYQWAAEGFAKEGFLPRAIAASKLVLELDPGHKGVQQMLADLYARKTTAGRTLGAKSSPSTLAAAPQLESEPIEIELARGESAADEVEVTILGEELPPAPPAAPAPPPTFELIVEEPAVSGEVSPTSPLVSSSPSRAVLPPRPPEPPAPPVTSAPSRTVRPLSAPEPSPAQPPVMSSPSGAVLPPRVAEPPAPPPEHPSPAPRLVVPRLAVTSSSSRPPEPAPPIVLLPLTPEAPADRPPNAAPAGLKARTEAAQPSAVLEGPSELERSLQTFAQFDRAPAAASFTELELEGDSLLHAVEAAATRTLAARGAPPPSPEETMEAPEDARSGELPKVPLFSDLPSEAFIALFERCPLRRFTAGGQVIEQGSRGDSFFVICAGAVKVVRSDGGAKHELATLDEGAFFGEMALLSDAPRSASVVASDEDTQLLEISASILAELSVRHPSVAGALKKFCRQRLLSNLMNAAPLFKPFTKSERRDLVQRFRARDAGLGEVLIREGALSDGLYVVLSGEVAVSVSGEQVAVLKEGDLFGEMSLLTRSPATASVRAARKTSLLRLPREDFDTLIMSHPQILELVSELMDTRTRANAALAQKSNAAASMV